MSIIKLILTATFMIAYIILLGLGIQHAKADDGQFPMFFLGQLPLGGLCGLLVGSTLDDWRKLKRATKQESE